MSHTINAHRWNPPGEHLPDVPGVYLLHGTGEHGGRYQRLASRLAARGWKVGAHDHPGHGRSTGRRGLNYPPGSLAVQAAIQVQLFAAETGQPPILFGHSLGGVLATELVLEHALPVAGLILSAPAFVPYIGPIDKIKLKLLNTFAPELCLDLGYSPLKHTHDEDEQAIAIRDTLNHGFKSASLVNWLFESGSRSIDNANQLAVDTLLLIAGNDLVVDSQQTKVFLGNVTQAQVTTHEYEGFYHELLNELPEWREKVAVDIERWLERYRQ